MNEMIAYKSLQCPIKHFPRSIEFHKWKANKKQLPCDSLMVALEHKTLSDRSASLCFRKSATCGTAQIDGLS